MSLNDVFKYISGVILSVGGAGAIFQKLSSYFGRIWAEKHLESIKKEYQKELEYYKAQLDLLKERSLLYSGRQFELYNKLWHSLYDLKLIGDMLWEEVTEKNFKKFSQQLKNTIEDVEKSYMFIEEYHYQEVKELLKQFSEYQFGKAKLGQLYRQKVKVNQMEIQEWVNHNKFRKEKYEELIDRIKKDLKKQIKGCS